MELGKNIATFGEIMLRFSPPDKVRLTEANFMRMNPGGAEANVAVSLAKFGHATKHITRLPENKAGDLIVQELRKHNVNTDGIVRGGERTGIYYLEEGTSVRSSQVVYDRRHSAFSEINNGMFDWDQLLDNVGWLHVSGITPALSEACSEVQLDVLKTAKAKGITVSFDFNYRGSLWTVEEAKPVFLETLKYVDVLFANRGVVKEVFGFESDDFRELTEQFKGITVAKYIAYTNRDAHSASGNSWQGILCEGENVSESETYQIEITDRIGAGDAFSAGIIHGIISGYDNQKTIEFATAASALKHTIPGDFNLSTEQEVLDLMNNPSPGYVKR